ncbi:succinyldiaminopimelate transaminase [Georgenia wangjunii]|uniref:succinyldiaminopimelate transaminase n=1 Tax=Georgenia wangjunii TaxID=3117730 RepID=UPI002F26CA47
MPLLGEALPAFPWDSLAAVRTRANEHPGGIVDLSVGTPVDPTPDVVRDALVAAADSPGYPTTQGTPALREAIVAWFARRRGVHGLTPDAVLPTIGSKELVALLPALLGLGVGDVVVHPRVAYPTYDVGARLAGAEPFPADATTAVGPGPVRLVWLNSPSNPTGRVLGVEHLAKVVAWARARGAVVASDECYAELAWEEPWASEGVPSILDERVNGGSHEGLLALYSVSKQSNLAGYRAAFAAGDPALIERLLAVRKHAGMIMPGPVQAALTAALTDDAHVAEQRERYRSRRQVLRAACEVAGLEVAPESEAGLYLWASLRDQPGAPCRAIAAALAERGILVAPGEFYGPLGAHHVRIALTASDERIEAAAARLAAGPLRV